MHSIELDSNPNCCDYDELDLQINNDPSFMSWLSFIEQQHVTSNGVSMSQHDDVISSTSSNLSTSHSNIPNTTSMTPITSKLTQKGMLSVSDLASLSWCESQTFYYATTAYKKIQTKAMDIGTMVHYALECEIMEPVLVKTESPEDVWGLR